MFFALANSRSYIARPAAVTGDTPRLVTPDGADGTLLVNALEDTTARLWRLTGAGQNTDVIVSWDAGAGNEITLSGIGLARADLGGASISVRHRQDAADPLVSAHTFTAPEGPLHLGRLFPETSARFWQLLISNAPVTGSVGWIWLGRWLRLPRGPEPPFTPPDLSTAYELSQHHATAAQSLGARAQLTAGRTTLVISDLSLPWLRGQWEPVRVHLAQGRPLLFIPDTAAGNTGLVQATGQINPVRQTTRALGGINIPLRYLP